jgi:hypothetical protein
MVESKQVTKGVLITLFLAIIFGFAADSYAGYLGVLITGVIMGYIVNLKHFHWIVSGLIVGLIAGFIMLIIAIIMVSISYSTGIGVEISFNVIRMDTIVYMIIMYGIIGSIGGSIGFLVRGQF